LEQSVHLTASEKAHRPGPGISFKNESLCKIWEEYDWPWGSCQLLLIKLFIASWERFNEEYLQTKGLHSWE